MKIPEKKKCAGQCVTGLFSYLCDRVDNTVKCGNGGRCCLSRSNSSNKKPAATTTPKPKPAAKCPGICMPGFMTAYCKAPAFLMPNNKGCSGTQVCCNNQGGANINKEDGPAPTQPPRPAGSGGFPIGALLNQALGAAAGGGGSGGGGGGAGGLIGQLAPLAASILGGGGGGGGGGGPAGLVQAVLPALLGAGGAGKRPVRPAAKPDRVDVNKKRPGRPQLSRPPPPPAPVDPRPICPDTCIGPFLSFTCFSKWYNILLATT